MRRSLGFVLVTALVLGACGEPADELDDRATTTQPMEDEMGEDPTTSTTQMSSSGTEDEVTGSTSDDVTGSTDHSDPPIGTTAPATDKEGLPEPGEPSIPPPVD